MKFIFWMRSFLMSFFIPILVIVFGIGSMFFHFLLRSRKVDNFNIRLWAQCNCWIFGIKVNVLGLENIPDGGCVYLFNHASFFDIFALCVSIPEVRFGAKSELFKIPIFAQAMRTMGTIPIARQNRSEVYKAYEEAKVRFKNKEKFALSPEGGRFYGPHLAPFKAGPFIFAMSAEAPLVPVVILGAHECLPKGEFLANKDRWSRVIEVQILKPVSSVGFTPATRQILQAQVFSAMDPVWSQHFQNQRD